LARGRSLPARLVERARIVSRAAAGLQDQEIASELGIMPEKAARWRNRYLDGGIPALEKDASRPGRPRTVTEDRTAEVIHKTTQEKPFNATHWSTRSMAAATGLSEATIRRIWHANGLKPHLVKSFKVSNDVQFAEKLGAIVGLYLNPPEHAIVLCADEKSQIQALDRTQPGLPIKKGRCGTMTHDYKRNGTVTLFAALDALDGTVISMCDDRHRHQEWLKFLRVIDQVAPPKGTASDRRQLCHAQASEGAAMAHSSSPVPYPLHAHQQFVAEHGGALLPGSHAESATARRLS
jgi:transposase